MAKETVTKTKKTTPRRNGKTIRATADLKDRAARVYSKLEALYPDAHCALIHENAFQLLIATILSAQCTDALVNKVTPALFANYPTPKALAEAEPAEVEAMVRSTNFYRNKAKSIQGAARAIVERFGDQVPDTMEDLLTLPGVARKTANVVLGNAFGKNVGMVVDTHIGRLAYRLGFTTAKDGKDAKQIEQDLMKLFPQETWTMLSHLLISHGRAICTARKPKCSACPLLEDCPQRGVEI